MTYFPVPKNHDDSAVLVQEDYTKETFSSYGRLDALAAVTDHLVWPVYGSPNLVVPPSPGVQMSVVSSDPSDAAAGTGIRTMELHYLDGSLNEASELITLTGTTPKLTVATDIRFIQCMHIVTVGSVKAAVGNIIASNGGITYSYIKAAARRCTSSARRIPAGYTFMVESIFASSISGNAQAESFVRLVTTSIATHDFTELAITIPHMGIGMQDGSESLTLKTPFPVAEGQVVALEATTTKTATITGGFIGYLVPNPI
jgi:hypothetical protein